MGPACMFVGVVFVRYQNTVEDYFGEKHSNVRVEECFWRRILHVNWRSILLKTYIVVFLVGLLETLPEFNLHCKAGIGQSGVVTMPQHCSLLIRMRHP